METIADDSDPGRQGLPGWPVVRVELPGRRDPFSGSVSGLPGGPASAVVGLHEGPLSESWRHVRQAPIGSPHRVARVTPIPLSGPTHPRQPTFAAVSMMRLLELTLADPASNLALDEALLLSHPSSESDADVGVLRLWEPPQMMVVLGRGSSAAAEVHRVACRRRDIPVLRRCSGGATIVTGPGCLMYSLVFRRTGQSALPAVNEIHTQILDQLAVALSTTAFVVVRSGTSDLAIAGPDGLRKFSGNSLRISRNLVLYHGTCLYDFPLGVVAELLAMPPRMPTYRQARSHDSFLCNLALRPEEIRQRVVTALQAHQTMLEWPQEMTSQLVASRYSLASWNEGARHG